MRCLSNNSLNDKMTETGLVTVNMSEALERKTSESSNIRQEMRVDWLSLEMSIGVF